LGGEILPILGVASSGFFGWISAGFGIAYPRMAWIYYGARCIGQ